MYAEMGSLRCCKHAGECISENLLTSFKTTSPPFCGAAKEEGNVNSFLLDLIVLKLGNLKEYLFSFNNRNTF